MKFQDIRKFINLVESAEKNFPHFNQYELELFDKLKSLLGSNPRLKAFSIERREIKPQNFNEYAYDDDDDGDWDGDDEWPVKYYLKMIWDASGYSINYEKGRKKILPIKEFDLIMGVGRGDGYFSMILAPGYQSFDLAEPRDIDDENYDMNSDDNHQNVYWWMYDDPRTDQVLDIFSEVVRDSNIDYQGPHGDTDGDPVTMRFGINHDSNGPLDILNQAASYSVEEKSPLGMFIKFGNKGKGYPPANIHI